jgi:hypothetical protein
VTVTLPLHTPPVRLIERVKRDNEHAVVALAEGQDAVVRVPSEGERARRLVMHCITRDELGSKVALRVDGVKAARTRFVTGGVDLTARASAGRHHVKVVADVAVRCLVEAVPARGHGLIERTAWALPEGALRLPIDKPGWATYPVTLVIYVAQDQPTPEIDLAIDEGKLRRRAGAVGRVTLARAHVRTLPAADPVIQLGTSRRFLRRAMVTTAALGDDLAPGRHVLQLSLVPSMPALLRAFAPGRTPRREKVEAWVTMEDQE